MQRFFSIALGSRVARKLAQTLAIRRRMQREQLLERRVTFVDQAGAPRFEAVQRGGIVMRLGAIMLERVADRFELGLVEFAQLFGEKLSLALACDVRRDGTRSSDFGAKLVVERQARELRVAQRRQRFGELEDFERVAALLAPARAAQLVGGIAR